MSAPSLSYFSIGSSPNGWTGFATALVIGGFLFGGWEAPLLFSEESKNPNFSPGRAAIVGVISALVWYLLLFVIFQGVASPANIEAHGADVLGYASTILAPDPWARFLPLAVFSALFAATQMQLTEASRVMFAMGQDRVLPRFVAKLHPRFRTPWVAALILGILPPLVLIPYLISSEAITVIGDIVGSVGLLYLAMYTIIPLACVVFFFRALRGRSSEVPTIVATFIGGATMLFLLAWGFHTPVSYTHLDVYKRQIVSQRFPQTSSPRRIASLIRQGILQNARFAAAVLVQGVKRGKKEDQHLLIRSDCTFPTLYQIRQQGRFTTPVAYATAHVAALFIKFFPKDVAGVLAPEQMPIETRRAIIAGIRKHSVRITHRVTPIKQTETDME